MNAFNVFACGSIRWVSSSITARFTDSTKILKNKNLSQNFLLPTDIEPEHLAELDDIRLFLTSVYDGSPVIIWFSDKEDSKICTENMDLAGDLIHSLASFLNIEDLKARLRDISATKAHSVINIHFVISILFQTTAFFPNITNRLNQYYERIGGYETTYSNLILDVAHKKFLAKNLLIQAEDARRYNE